MADTVDFGTDPASSIRIHDLPKTSSIKSTDLFVIDSYTTTDSGTADYTTAAVRGETLASFILNDLSTKNVTVSKIIGGIDASESSLSALVPTVSNTTDKSKNAASTEGVNNFWNEMLGQDVTVRGTWTFNKSMGFNNLANDHIVAIDNTDYHKLTVIDSITTGEVETLNGIRSNVQEQIDGKASTSSPTINSLTVTNSMELKDGANFTSGKVLILEDHQLKSSTVSISELKCLQGLDTTKTIQQQLNSKTESATTGGKANDNEVVKLTGNQSIAGEKTFTDCTFTKTPDTSVNDTHTVNAEWVNGKNYATQSWVNDNYAGKTPFTTLSQNYNAHVQDESVHTPDVTESYKGKFLSNDGSVNKWVDGVTKSEFNTHANSTDLHLPDITTASVGDKIIVATVDGNKKPKWQAVGTIVMPDSDNLVLKSTAKDTFGWYSMVGVPTGGSAGQCLSKNANNDGYEWKTVTVDAGVTKISAGTGISVSANTGDVTVTCSLKGVPTPGYGDAGKVLQATDNWGTYSWKSISSGVTSVSTTGGLISMYNSSTTGNVIVKSAIPTPSYGDKDKVLKVSNNYGVVEWAEAETPTETAIFVGSNITYCSSGTGWSELNASATREIYTATEDCYFNINCTFSNFNSNMGAWLLVNGTLVSLVCDSGSSTVETISWSGFVKSGYIVKLNNPGDDKFKYHYNCSINKIKA